MAHEGGIETQWDQPCKAKADKIPWNCKNPVVLTGTLVLCSLLLYSYIISNTNVRLFHSGHAKKALLCG